jgi:chromosomal replication initiator protein dnaA
MQTFETFNVTDKNKFGMASALAMTDFTKCFEPVLFLFGQSGVGKTHLLKAMEQEAVKGNPNLRVRYVTGAQFMKEYNDSVTYGEVADYMEEYCKLHLLLVDDVQDIVYSDDEGAKKMFMRLVLGMKAKARRMAVTFDDTFDSEDRSNELQNELTDGVVAFIE